MAVLGKQMTFADVDDEYKQFVEKFKPKQPAPTYYTPPSIIMDIQSARAQDATAEPSKRLEILLINPPFSARKAKRNRKREQ